MPSMQGMNYMPHDKTFFGDRIAVPNEITPIWWTVLPPMSVFSAPNMMFDYISVGQSDENLLASLRTTLGNLSDSLLGIDYASGATDFVKRGFFDLQGWIISGDYPLGESNGIFTATPEQLVDDYIRKIPVPYVSGGNTLTPDQQLQTVRESIGENRNTDEEGLENVDETSNPNEGEATKHMAVIDQAAWYDLGPHMFFERREWLGIRHGNAIPIAEQKQRYAGNVNASIQGIRSSGKYAIVMFTVSMPHINAMGTDYDEKDEPVSIYDNWMELIMTNQYAPFDQFAMQDEVTLQQARARGEKQARGETDASNTDVEPGHFRPTANYDKYITMKRQYSVKPGLYEQKPLYFSMNIDWTETIPFTFLPNRM